MVRRGPAGIAPADLGFAGLAAGKTDPLRGRPRDQVLGRSAPPRVAGPPLLRLFPPADARRAAHLRGGGVRQPDGRRRAGAAGQHAAAAGPGQGALGHLLFHFEYAARPEGHQLRQLPAQARGRAAAGRTAQAQVLRHPVADPGLRGLAGQAGGRGGRGHRARGQSPRQGPQARGCARRTALGRAPGQGGPGRNIGRGQAGGFPPGGHLSAIHEERAAGGSRGAVPPGQRRAHRTAQLGGGHVAQGAQAVLRHDGQLSLRPG
ncbi:hypothetical protein D9M68_697260 [compost metagenome]